MAREFKLTVKRAYAEKSVALGVAFAGYGEPWISGKMTGTLSTVDARALAGALIAEADRADAVAAKKSAEAERRAKWHAREVASGRIQVLTAEQFLGRR